MQAKGTTPWYVGGLHFECRECGRCCSGPGEGYIWVVRREVELIAEFLKITPERLRRRYLRRVGLRTSIIEHGATKDCIFLQSRQGKKCCLVYPVRPTQCRSWPFWPENLKSRSAWSRAALKCLGIDRGRLYTCEEIERIRKAREWWLDRDSERHSCEE